ncbi:hypothetical protein BGZ73_000297 [Actinomortierella ambigua]|nr:hypothetical protein BGZ73_000297 [Actinomortierella ambigua]
MRFSSAPLATAVALASIVCLATTPVEAKSPDKGQHNSHSERSLHKHKGEKDEAQALWNNGHHHHHHRSKHHKKNKHHKSKYENGKCPRKGKGVCVNLVCDGTVIDELYCPKGSKSPAFNVSDIGAQYNGGGGYKRYVVMQPPCSNKLPPSCEPVADALVSDDSQDDVDDDYIARWSL